jgi:hypothetical protein
MLKRVALAAVAAMLAVPVAASARVIQAETVLPPGQSGHVPQQGQPDNPHLTDQVSLFEAFAFKPAGFDQPGTTESPAAGVAITRDAYGVPNMRAGNDHDLWLGVGYAMAEALKDAAVRTLPAAARGWLGEPGRSHAFDFGGADGAAFLALDAAGLRRAAARAATALGDPSTWWKPRRMYDVTVLGLATKPALRFYDRGTWQQAVELGP